MCLPCRDQLRKGEELRRKMELGDDDSSSEDDQEEPGLWNEAAEKPKGIFALDFMKRGTVRHATIHATTPRTYELGSELSKQRVSGIIKELGRSVGSGGKE